MRTAIFDSKGVADPSVEIKFGPNIKDWPAMSALPDNLVLQVVSEIHDPVTTTDELIPSGETSSYRSNPLGLAEFTLSRKDPAVCGPGKGDPEGSESYGGRHLSAGSRSGRPESSVWHAVQKDYPDVDKGKCGLRLYDFCREAG